MEVKLIYVKIVMNIRKKKLVSKIKNYVKEIAF